MPPTISHKLMKHTRAVLLPSQPILKNIDSGKMMQKLYFLPCKQEQFSEANLVRLRLRHSEPATLCRGGGEVTVKKG